MPLKKLAEPYLAVMNLSSFYGIKQTRPQHLKSRFADFESSQNGRCKHDQFASRW